MPSEASFSINTAISEIASARRADAVRPERGEGKAGPDTFGALVSEAAHARNDARKALPPAETQKEPVDPRPAPERRSDADTRADRAGSRRSTAGHTHGSERKAPVVEEKGDASEKGEMPENDETVACSDEMPACRDGFKAKTTDTEVGATTETVGDVAVTDSGKIDGVPTLSGATTVGTTASVPVPATLEGILDGLPVNAGGADKTGGPMTPLAADVPVPVAEVVAQEVSGSVSSAIGTAKGGEVPESSEAETTGVVVETDASIKTVEAATANAARSTVATSQKPGVDIKAETGIEKVAAKAGVGEEAAPDTKATDGGTDPAKKPVTPDLNPTRLTRVADMLESLGVSNAIHRPADILAGLDRAVQASALNGAHNRATEVARATPLQMLPIEIGMQAVRGVTNFQIRLDPAELGRVDVKLQIRDNGEVNASLVVDRVETLAMLKRDASTLQQAFEQAGLRQSADGLSFSLRGEGQNGEARRDNAHGSAGTKTDENALPAEIAEVAMRRAYVPNSNLDLMI